MAASPLRVMIVEDSAVVRTLLCRIVEEDERMTVVAAVATAEEAIARLDAIAPDVISMDINLPGIDGLEATRRIMAQRPTPIVVVSGAGEGRALASSMDALRAGALSLVEKPTAITGAAFAAIARDIRTQLAIMSEVPVVRRRIRPPSAVERVVTRRPRAGAAPRLLACAASTGGPQALARVLGALPASFPLPVLVVQHMGASFMEGFARWLDGVVPLAVSIAVDGERPQPGRIHVAPGERHLRLGAGERLMVADDPSIRGQRPAATALFESVADVLGPAALGVVLTGMGEDGGPGVEKMVRAGAPVLAEDRSTAIVFGMPAAAVQGGAMPMPLGEIAGELERLVGVLR